MAKLDYVRARDLLRTLFESAEQPLETSGAEDIPRGIKANLDTLFASNTQAYREALVGCVLARMLDRSIDITLPYVSQGATAYAGRDLDEQVVNPFLKDKGIPSSKGPFLSVFRRTVKFTPKTRAGVRDKPGFDAFLALLKYVRTLNNDDELSDFLTAILYGFVALREQSNILIARVQRLSLAQYSTLTSTLLSIPSGGRFPVFLVVATFRALNDAFNLGWSIEYQGINVADAASGEAGDITVKRGTEILMAAEVTERVVDKSRVISTFTTKIAPSGIQDYLFFVRDADPEAYKQAQQYFSQGHEVNFLSIERWILDILAVLGPQGRASFNRQFTDLLDGPDVKRSMKIGWNAAIQSLTST